MSHLGIVTSTALASRGFEVIGYDPDEHLTGNLGCGLLPIDEPSLEDLISSNVDRQAFTSDLNALASCDLVYIAVDVPTDDEGKSDLGPVEYLVRTVSPRLGPEAILVILSQVPPGFSRAQQFPHDRLYYQVETLVFGRAVERACKPERYIVGCADPGRTLPPALQIVLDAFDCPVFPIRYESAELAKISINLCLVSSVTIANTIAELCEMVGADWAEIVPTLREDQRIGRHAYINAGLGIAGGNLERDLATFLRLSDANGTQAAAVEAAVESSRYHKDWAIRRLRQAVIERGTDPLVAIWGLAYKENTHSTKNSPALALIHQVPRTRLRLYDPLVPASAAGHPLAEQAESPIDALQGAQALAIMTPWATFRDIGVNRIAQAMSGSVIIDPYGVLNRESVMKERIEYHTLGSPPLIQAEESD